MYRIFVNYKSETSKKLDLRTDMFKHIQYNKLGDRKTYEKMYNLTNYDVHVFIKNKNQFLNKL